MLELSYFLLLDAVLLPTATKPKTIQTEEVSMTGSNHNVTANTSQDREFILVENERIGIICMFNIPQLCCCIVCLKYIMEDNCLHILLNHLKQAHILLYKKHNQNPFFFGICISHL